MSNEAQRAGTGTDREKLAGALETVFEVLGGDRIEAVLNLVTELEHRLSGSITSVSERSTTATDGVRNDLTTRIDEAFGKLDDAFGKLDELFGKLDSVSARLGELDDRQKSAHDSFEQRIGESSADLTRQLKESESIAEDRIRALKDELGSDFASKEDHINKELDTLGRNLTGIQLEFGQHTRATERMSIVLDGLANVLKGDPPPPATAEAAREGAAPQAGTIDPAAATEAGVDEDILDNALERVFSKDPA
jgi:hypothetical protein